MALTACQDVGRNFGDRFSVDTANTVFGGWSHDRICLVFDRDIDYLCLLAGVDAHGGNVQNGCGVKFVWSSAPPYKGDRGERKTRVSGTVRTYIRGAML